MKQFTSESKLEVAPKFDTEANKSVGLYQELIREANRPRGDVFWNNEILSTIRLQKKGLLEVVSLSSRKDYPPWTQASDGTWQAFASRARVLIVNTDLVPEAKYPHRSIDLLNEEWKGKLVMAKPQFGTTATQVACLFEVLGKEPTKAFYRGLKKNDIAIVAGNKQVAEQVAAGRFALGLTDQDDAIGEIDAKKPVTLLFLDREGDPENPRLGTLLIPNTLAVLRNSPNKKGGEQLMNFLLGSAQEKHLAEGGGFQIPLNPTVDFTPHPALKEVKNLKPMEVNWERAAEWWDEVQAFLREEFAR